MSRIVTDRISRRLGSTEAAKPLTIVPDCASGSRGERGCGGIRRGEGVSNGSSGTIDYGCVGEWCRTKGRPGGFSRLTHRPLSKRRWYRCRGGRGGGRGASRARGCSGINSCSSSCSSYRQGFASIGFESMIALCRTEKCYLHCLGHWNTCRI
jgi:hypothetical protein